MDLLSLFFDSVMSLTTQALAHVTKSTRIFYIITGLEIICNFPFDDYMLYASGFLEINVVSITMPSSLVLRSKSRGEGGEVAKKITPFRQLLARSLSMVLYWRRY